MRKARPELDFERLTISLPKPLARRARTLARHAPHYGNLSAFFRSLLPGNGAAIGNHHLCKHDPA